MGWYRLRIRADGAIIESGADQIVGAGGVFNVADGGEFQIEGQTVSAGAYHLNAAAYSPEHYASGIIDVNTGAAEAGTEVVIGGAVYLEDTGAGADPTLGIWVRGASQEDTVDSLLAAINGDTRAEAAPVTAIKVGTHSIVLYADEPGAVGNLDITTDSASNVTVEDMAGGQDAGLLQVVAIERTVTAQDVLADRVHIKLPFEPSFWRHYVVDDSGAPKTPTGAVTLETGPPVHIMHIVGSGTSLAADDVIHVLAFR